MKTFILLLVPLLMFQSMAFADTATGLKALIDDYRYSLTVEWDQKDEAALQVIQANFQRDLKAQQVTLADLKAVLSETAVQDQEILSILNIKDQAVMAGELQKLIDTRGEQMYSRGTSWSPMGVFWTGAGILLVIEIIVLAMKDSSCPNSVNYPEGVHYDCEWQ